MSHHLLSRLSVVTLAAVSLGAALLLRAQNTAPAASPPAAPAPAQKPAAASADEDIVGPVQMRGDTLDAVLVLIGKWTGRSIIRPQALPATEGYTLSLPPMPKSEAVRALETMLDLSGIAVTPLGDRFLKVVPLGQARTEAPEMIEGSTLDLPPSGRIASKLFVFNFLRVSEIKDQITPLLNPNLGGPVLFEKTNGLLITDSVSTLQRIEQLAKQLDQPAITGLQPKFYSLQFAKASDLVNKITAILKPPLSNQLSSATSLTADDRTNQIVLLCDPRQYQFFDELISKLDVKADPNTRNEVIYLKHATAKDVATLLTNLVMGRSQATSRTDQTGARPGQPAAGPVTQTLPTGGTQPAAGALSNLLSSGNPTADFSSLVTVLADDRSNSIVVSGTVDDLRLIKEIVEKVDVLLAQVSIQVVIAEVSLSDSDTSGINALNLTFGTDAVRGTHITNFDTASSTGGTSGLAGWNITAGVVNPLSFQAALTNTGARNNVKILSANTIVTTHNREADFKVTQQQPIITGSTSGASGSTTGLTTSSTVTYKDIGIEVKVTPLIGDDGSIQLQIDQIVDDVVGYVTIDGNQQPIIGHRQATSFVNVNDGQMIVLGGLQQTKHSASRTKLGFLYEIPILSNLLGARTHETDRTELLLFVRPHIIPPGDATRDATKSIDQLSSRDQVRQYLADPAKLPKESVIERYYK
jgi:general secretion pathway protein D